MNYDIKITGDQDDDGSFARKPITMTAQQQLLFQSKQGKNIDLIKNLLGKWPGDESDEEFDKLIKNLD